jgi:hypothetical protein
MALHFDLKVNKQIIGWFVARRQELEIPADGICTYDITVEYMDGRRQARYVVRHAYHDGAFAPVQAAFAALPAGEKDPRA